jgi:hypothetical protein
MEKAVMMACSIFKVPGSLNIFLFWNGTEKQQPHRVWHLV